MRNSFPQFSTINPDLILPMITKIIADNRSQLAARLQQGAPYTWDNLAMLMESLAEQLHQAWSPIQHLHTVLDTPALRTAYHACLPLLTEYSTDLGQNRELYQAYQYLHDSDEFATLDIAQQKVISNTLRDFKLSGVLLIGTVRERYRLIQQQLAQLHAKFEENILDSTEAWHSLIVDHALLAGLPLHTRENAKLKAQQKNLAGWLLTLDQPTYVAIMQYADNRSLREQVYRAYQTRASELSNEGRFDNTPLINEILTLATEAAQLLGFANYADYALATKMAAYPATVVAFLRKLAHAAKPFAQQELSKLKKFAAEQANIELASWDVAYYSEKLRHTKFNIDDEALRVYFPLNRVLAGICTIIESLYGMQVIEISEFDRWHPQVRLLQLSDQDQQIRGHVYLDLYARSGKRSGAWMNAYCSRFKKIDGLQTPIAYLTCNFSPAVDVSLLTHDEVTTLFHEFGHCLQHVLTKINYPAVAGINGVAWDAVELPSQFFENWCWNLETLPLISGHYQTNQPMPATLLTQLIAAKNFQTGLQTLRQVEFALFDIRLYREFDSKKPQQLNTILQTVRDEVSVFQPPEFTRFATSFAHIFSGGYAAGYYGYKWAEVLSADAFERFLQEGILNPQTGREFLQAILETGGSRDANELFIQFRGREPNIEALLKQMGMG